MAKIVFDKHTASDMSAFNIGNFEIPESADVTANAHKCTVVGSLGFGEVFTGTGFGDFDPTTGVPQTGLIDTWTATLNDATVFTVTKMNMSWEDYNGFTGSGDTNAFFQQFLAGKDQIIGSAKNDSLFSGDGNDTLKGGDGRDTMNGQGGNDKLIGGKGTDILTGGSGADRFIFTSLDDSGTKAFDTITDFHSGQDKIDLTKIDPDLFLAKGDTFSGTAHEMIQFAAKDGHLHLQGDIGGDGFADFDIRFDGKLFLHSDDFI